MSATPNLIEPLPTKPSLEMQQKRAKDLARAVWAGEPEALARIKAMHPQPPDNREDFKLSDAQLVVARGYGFRDWAAMRRKIESLTLSPYDRFVAALKRGETQIVRELLETHAEVRARINEPVPGTFDAPPVHVAKKNLPLLDVLLAHGADINTRTRWWAGGFGVLEWDCTPELAEQLIARGARVDAWAAAYLGRLDDLKRIIQSGPSVLNAKGGDGKTPLHCAANVEVARYLLDRGADIEARDVDHESTPLQYLIDKPDVARLLIERGAKVDIFAAAALGDLDLIRRCIAEDPSCVTHRLGSPPWVTSPEAGGKIYNWTLGHSLTVLDVARQKGHDEAYRLLLDHAPPVTRFQDAIWRGDREEALALHARHPGLVAEVEKDPRHALPHAVWWDNLPAVKLMLDLGFDPHLPGVHNSTPLDRAAFHGFADIIELLLERDPDPPLAHRNEFGGTPLSCCVHSWAGGWSWMPLERRDHARSVELLLKAGSVFDPTWLPTGNDAVDATLRSLIAREGK